MKSTQNYHKLKTYIQSTNKKHLIDENNTMVMQLLDDHITHRGLPRRRPSGYP